MTTAPDSKDPRQERLALALRENLKRRKAQIRERAELGRKDAEMPVGEGSDRKG